MNLRADTESTKIGADSADGGEASSAVPDNVLRRCFQSTLGMVLVALAIRFIVMGFLYDEQLDPARDHWPFGYEVGRLARSIATGHGFSSPLFEETGPSAWMTPVYPYFVAGVFRVFGIYTKASAFVLLSSQALISALTCIPVFFVANKLFGRAVARWSGWAWVLFPYAVYFPEERIWGTWLSTLQMSVLFLITLYLEKSDRLWHWIGFGLLWAFSALTDPIVLSAWPFLAGWAAYCLYRQKRRWMLPLAVSALALIVGVSPWFVRNYVTFGRFIPFRDGLGLELAIGNTEDSYHWRPRDVGPWHNDAEWQAFKDLGELGYMEKEKKLALDYIRSHPRWFVVETGRRFIYIWTGYWSFSKQYLAEEPLDPPNVFFCTLLTVLALVGLRRVWKEDAPRGVFLAAVLLFFCSVYYVTHVEVYFRRQIDPILMVLAVYGVASREKRVASN